MMKVGRGRERLFLILGILSVVCFGFVGTGYAAPFPLESYISITIPDELDFGSIPHPGNHVFTHTFSMHIAANVPHHVEMSLSVLGHSSGSSYITPTNLQVLNPISSGQGTPIGGMDVDVQLQFDIKTTMADQAGTYQGTLTITAMIGP